MIRKKLGAIEWLEFELFASYPHLKHAVFLRNGGVSSGAFKSLNASKWKGDDPANVDENRRRIASILKIPHLILARGVHGKTVELVTEVKEEYPDCDGLVTSAKNWGLLVTHADCQAAIFYDPIHQAIANVHAGWRGQVQNIYKEAVLKMNRIFDSNPKDLLVGIAPSLGPANAEFKNFSKELPADFWRFQVKPTYFDLWALAHHQLEECGIRSENIQIARLDTFANAEDFFSYRRVMPVGNQEKTTGCHATVVALS